MPNTATVREMLDDLRAEIGASMSGNFNISVQDAHIAKMRRVQRELYAANDWPDLVMEEQATVSAGDQYLPALTYLDYEQINEVWCRSGGSWTPMCYGIGPREYNQYNPADDDRSFPVQRYRYDASQPGIEIWPLPNQSATFLLHGQRGLAPLREVTDSSTLDHTLIVLFTAADILASLKKEDASLKIQQAQNYLRSLRKNLISHKRRVTGLTNGPTVAPRAYLDYIPEA